MIYTGDILIQQLDDDNIDIKFVNGQPEMTNGFDTFVQLAVYGEDWWGNELTNNESEKMKSDFPSIIRRGNVSDTTANDGTKALEKALQVMKTEKMAKNITVEGAIISVYGIGWQIEIEALTDTTLKYFINWERGSLTMQQVG
jgi:hypothetical protein